MSRIKTIAKNSMALFVSTNITKVITLFLTIIIARYLGTADFGKLSFALGFTSLFGIIIDVGTKILLVRDIQEDRKKTSKLIGNVVLLKIISSILVAGLIFIIINLLGYPADTRFAVYMGSAIIILESLAGTFGSAFQAFEQMQYPAFTKVFRVSLRFIMTLPVLLAGYGLVEVMTVYALVHVVNLAYVIYLYHRKIGKVSYKLDLNLIKSLLSRSWPFALSGLLIVVYFRIDITMLSLMKGDVTVGLYTASYTLLDALISIPTALAAALLPVAIQYFKTSKTKLVELYRRSVHLSAIISMPLMIGGILVAGPLMSAIYGGEYEGSITALKILLGVLPLVFTVYTLGIIMIAIKKEKTALWILLGNSIVNVALNFILIPTMSFNGAAIATVGAEIFYFIMYYWLVTKVVGWVNIPILFVKPFIASLVMAGSIILMPEWNVFAIIILGAIVYIITLFLIQGVQKEDWQSIRKIVNR